MTVAAQDPINQFTIVGGETSGPWTWQLNADADLTVFKQLASSGEILTLTLDTDYSVNPAGLGNKLGGTINFLAPQLPAVAGDVWTLQRDTVLKRSKDFATSGDFLAVTVNPQMDDPILMTQDSKRDADNALRKNPGVSDVLDPLIPQPVSGRALKIAESSPGNFIITMSETDPDDGSVKTVAGLFATSLSTPSNLVVQESQDGFEIRVNTSSGDVDITLPDSSSLTSDFRVGIVKTTSDSNVVNIKVQGSDTLNGGTSDFVEDSQFTRIIFVLDQSLGAYVAGLDKVGLKNVVEDTSPQYGAAMDSNGFSLNESQGAAVASAAQPNIWAGDGNTIHITGNATINDFTDAPRAGAKITLIFDAILILKNGLGITLQGASDIVTKIGDRFEVYADAVNVFSGIYTRKNAPSPFATQFLHVEDQKAATTSGGTFTSGAFRIRDLTTVLTNEIVGASLGSNQITLPDGDYYIEASAPGYSVNQHATKIRDVNGAVDLRIGTAEIAPGGSQTRSFVSGRFTISGGPKPIELRHRSQTSQNTNGFGIGDIDLGVLNIFSIIKLWKVG